MLPSGRIPPEHVACAPAHVAPLHCGTSESTLRAVKNPCFGSLIEAVRDRTETVDLKQVNAVLLQPHWRHNPQYEPQPPILTSNHKTATAS